MAPDPLSLLTKRVSLPVKCLSTVQMMVLVEAISEAWRRMLADWPTLAAGDAEAQVNGAMSVQLLVALRQRSPLSSLVNNVQRGVEQYNYNGTKFEKRPDLNFFFTRRDAAFPLAAECKIIDAGNGQTVRRYGSNGIARFTSGDYGWFNAQGIMIAYVRDGTDPGPAISHVVGAPAACWPTQDSPHFMTTHPRAFAYVDRSSEEGSPGPISLVHVWLHGAPEEVNSAANAQCGPDVPRGT